MKNVYLLTITLIFLSNLLSAQETRTIHLTSLSDSFIYAEAGYSQKVGILNGDTVAFGTSYYGNVFNIVTDVDSIKIKYDPRFRPDEQAVCIKIRSPKNEEVLFVTFYGSNCWFSDGYIKKNTDTVGYEIPEVYELANVLYALTKSSAEDTNRIYKGTQYHKDVLSYFSRFKNSPLIRQLEFSNSTEGTRNYYNFRDNSICFKVEFQIKSGQIFKGY